MLSSALEPLVPSALKVRLLTNISESLSQVNLNFNTSTCSSPNLGFVTDPFGAIVNISAATQPTFIVLATNEP